MRRVSFLLLVATAMSACSGSPGPNVSAGPSSTSTPTSTSSPSSGSTASTPVRLRTVADVPEAVAMAALGGDLYVASKAGRIFAIRGGRLDPQPVLDISSQVTDAGEQGLLGLAFAPSGDELYVSFSDNDGNSNVDAASFAGGHVTGSLQRVLFVDQPYSNHNGGNLAFGPDGDLYIGLGDGGSEGDPHGYGQSLGTLLGKMLRISPHPGEDPPYTVPADNPFVGRAGVRPEIWAYALRNPWRYSFDSTTGDLWIGDVGQNQWEEIDEQRASSHGGQNYGWNRLEGTHPYHGAAPRGAVGPVYQYSHEETKGCAVTGGFVYRGQAIPSLSGAYVFADFCVGHIMALRLRPGVGPAVTSLGLTVPSLASFGQDEQGELYALSLVGHVLKLVP